VGTSLEAITNIVVPIAVRAYEDACSGAFPLSLAVKSIGFVSEERAIYTNCRFRLD